MTREKDPKTKEKEAEDVCSIFRKTDKSASRAHSK